MMRRLPLAAATLCLVACSGTPPEQTASVRDRFAAYVSGELTADEAVKLESEIFVKVQDEIVDCMSSAGFVYIRSSPTGYISAPTDIGNRSWVEVHGYGISTGEAPEQTASDPNAGYIESLSNEGRTSFQTALSGLDGASGCAESAYTDIYSAFGLDQVNQAASRIGDVLNDVRVIAADEAWSSCAASFGVQSPSILKLTDDLSAEFQALGDDAARITSFRTREISIATLLFDCTLRRNQVVRTVNREYLEKELTKPSG